MIATSVAARGLDVKGLNLVVNYTVSTQEYPDMYRYIHRYTQAEPRGEVHGEYPEYPGRTRRVPVVPQQRELQTKGQ
jgi:hypothetical protein